MAIRSDHTSAEIDQDEPPLEQARKSMRARGIFDNAIVFWRGISGHEYIHSAYTLSGCPEVPPACVLLVSNKPESGRIVLRVMTVDETAASLNLATIRQCGALLGANEVHLHFAGGDREARHTAACDLRTMHGGVEIVGS